MSSPAPSNQQKTNPNLAGRANLLGLGWQIASTLLVFTGGGYALDRWLDTLPWFLLTGAMLGMIGVFVQIFRIATELDRAEKARKQRLKKVKKTT